MLSYPLSNDHFIFDTDTSNIGGILSELQIGHENIIEYKVKQILV